MAIDPIDRLFDMLEGQNQVLAQQGALLAKISQAQTSIHESLFGENGHPGIVQEVALHGRQISFWRGGFAVMAFLWSAALAYGKVVLNHRK